MLYKVLASAPRPGLELKEVLEHRGGKSFITHRWMSPAEVAEAKQKGQLVEQQGQQSMQPERVAGGGGQSSQQIADVRKRFVEERARSPRQEFLTPNSEEDLANHTVVMLKGGKVGYAISPEGDLQNVFNNNGQGAGAEAICDAIARGARTLDCFDGFLPMYYTKFGFVKVREISWDDQYAPKSWDYGKLGRPNVVFMEYKGGTQDANEVRRVAEANGIRLPFGPEAGGIPSASDSGQRAGVRAAKQGASVGTMGTHQAVGSVTKAVSLGLSMAQYGG